MGLKKLMKELYKVVNMEPFEVYKKEVLLEEHDLYELSVIYDELLRILDNITKLSEMKPIDREIRFALDEDDKYLWDNRLTLKGNYYVTKKALFEKRYGVILLN